MSVKQLARQASASSRRPTVSRTPSQTMLTPWKKALDCNHGTDWRSGDEVVFCRHNDGGASLAQRSKLLDVRKQSRAVYGETCCTCLLFALEAVNGSGVGKMRSVAIMRTQIMNRMLLDLAASCAASGTLPPSRNIRSSRTSATHAILKVAADVRAQHRHFRKTSHLFKAHHLQGV